jgi:checkpoint serine/threonine-protein kinase
VRRGVFGVEPPAQILEEDEEQEGSARAAPSTSTAERPYLREIEEDEEDEEDMRAYARRRGMRCGGAFDMMTPITERTCEFTSTTQAMTMRSSISSAPYTQTNGQAADEAFLGSTVDEAAGPDKGLATETSAIAEDHFTLNRNEEAALLEAASRERSKESPFCLSEGHSIESRDEINPTISTLVIVEKPSLNTGEATSEVAEDLPVTTVPPAASASNTVAEAAPPPVAAFIPAAKAASPFDPPNPCNPLDDDVLGAIVRSTDLSGLPGFSDLRHMQGNRLEGLQKTARSRMRRNSSSSLNKSQSSDSTDWELEIGGRHYQIKDKIGEGGFGAVFKAVDVAAYEAELDASDDEDEEEEAILDGASKSTVALKVENPPNMWEAIVLNRIRERLPSSLHPSVVRSRGLYCYADESFMVMDYHSQGTLLDAVNKASSMGLASAASGAPGGIDELAAVFFAVELLRLVEGLHRADFIHGDLKIDNCLVRLDECRGWSSQYDRTGGNGWSAKGIRLIDFGRAIDLQCFPAGRKQTFVADWPVDSRDCQEIRTGRPWSFEADYHGIASICYCMLFGKYISTEVAPSLPEDGIQKRYRIAGEKLRRVSFCGWLGQKEDES